MCPDVVGCALTNNAGGSLAQHTVELVEEKIHRLMRVLGRNRSLEIRAAYFDMALGRKEPSASTMGAFNFDPKPEYPRLVTKQSFCLGFDRRLRGVIEIKVNTAKNHLRIETGQSCSNHILRD